MRHLMSRDEIAAFHVCSCRLCAHLYLTTKARRIPRRSCILRSCIFMSCYLVPYFQVLHFHALRFGPSFSGPVFSCPAIWSSIFRSYIFSAPLAASPGSVPVESMFSTAGNTLNSRSSMAPYQVDRVLFIHDNSVVC